MTHLLASLRCDDFHCFVCSLESSRGELYPRGDTVEKRPSGLCSESGSELMISMY